MISNDHFLHFNMALINLKMTTKAHKKERSI